MPEKGHDDRLIGKREFLKWGARGLCALGLAGVLGAATPARAHMAQKGLIKVRRSPWFTELEAGHIQCDLCPWQCRIAPGRRGLCRVRENRGGRGYSLVYGNPCLVQLDPVERKPLFHVLPGSQAMSVCTTGCNIACKFCEVWDMALAAPEDVYAYDLPPETAVSQARQAGAQSMSFAFGEPVVFYEYMAAIATLAKEAGMRNLLHTNGFIARGPLRALAENLDAANIDLKGFDPAFYRDVCGGELAPVLDSLQLLKALGVHIEITNTVIPSLNDDPSVMRKMCRWIARELGSDVPVHFARFYPLYKLANLPATPVLALDRARSIAREEGLKYVYVARVTGHEGENTFCPDCGKRIIQRLGFVVEEMHLNTGHCGHCGASISGVWA